MVTVQENERKRIARDLHDQLGQQLTALRLKLTAMRAEFEKGKAGPASIERLQEIAEQIDSSVTFIASQLRPIALDELGLQETLRMYVKEWSRRFEVPADFHSNVASKHHLSSEVETHLYRIAQEALNNTIKHSGASEVAVALEQSKKGVVLVIEDNGCGFDPSSPPRRMHGHGFGLAGMAERANLIGAELEIESKRGRGTTVYVRIPPLKKPSASTNGVRA
jgi:signal transduction histidine kinase